MARRFLVLVAILATLVLVLAIVWRLAGQKLVTAALAPTVPFAESTPPPAPRYSTPAAWIAHPKLPGNPALFAPQGYRPAPAPAAAVFFVPPTAFFGRSQWNAPLDDPQVNARLDRYVEAQASPFNGLAEIWAPRYRQATFGSFLKPSADAEKALALAYADVAAAFDAFVAAQPADRPILLAGHSQGARHLLRLVAERVKGTPLAARVVAVYAIGWPVALPADPAALGLPPCAGREQAGCLLSWQSFAADGDQQAFIQSIARIRRVDGKPFGTAPMLCINPLSGAAAPPGRAGPAIPAEANAGTLRERELVPRLTGARCAANGLLLLDPAPSDIGPYVLPGGNFHVYDISLFWAAVRADAEARLMAHAARTLGGPAG
ncbi:DUF3089 domain-containing protein [Thermaurantiacus sp.]